MANMLDELIHQYMDDEVAFDVIIDFCDMLEPTVENKQMLIDCIDCYDIDVLYKTLFCKCKDFLSVEEEKEYRDRFLETFDQAMYSDDYLDW